VRTKRWNDPVSADDGFRLLICRYRPRGVPKLGEPWDAWCNALAPSKELHAARYGKTGAAIDFAARRYWIESFAERVRAGETLTLLCSSACEDAAACHRTLVQGLIEAAAADSGKPQVTRGRPPR
jgi:uncharacterized protein YeaO (DUF488 family)